ncbi:lysophospholipase [Amycolatopsis sp.]|uniref:alpha/beta hydrolase n=1 Tax=Amycolatopsis sp. TaxID=37632 RepID=UPI002D146EB3|nr:lysophospholipase [Amycolatopsis sp.]HVV08344.1 lysophospholipase [Amycolatopsis sp.]
MTAQTPHLDFDEPDGLAARGTVVVLPGRGERPGLYARFGRRLAADAYRVRVAGDATADLEAVSAQVKGLVADAVAPVVLAGSDTGALLARYLVASGAVSADALVLAGLPGSRTIVNEEVELRASCPTHQKLLRAGEHVELGALRAERIPPVLREPVPPLAVPALGLHGENDFVSPYAEVAGDYAGARVSFVDDGRHDVLNSAHHRSVAATVVLFLEELRAERPPITGAGDVR